MGCLVAFRKSAYVVVIIVFLSLFTDSLLLTLVDPILPDILANLGDSVSQVSQDFNNTNVTTNPPAIESVNMNGRYGYLVAAKGAAQFICNPFVGLIVTRFGYRIPMLIGDLVLMLSTIAFAFGDSYGVLFGTRVFQGASSSVAAVTGMGLLAAVFTDDDQRGKVMGVAIGGISLGIIVGPVYGSILYQFFGQAVPFIVVAAMVGLCLLLQLITLQADPGGNKDHSMSSILGLLADPYILIVAGNIFLLNLDVSVILAFLPLRLIELESPATWKLGIVVLPTSIGYLLAGVICPRSTGVFKRWMCGLVGLIISAGTMIGLAFCTTFMSMLIVTTFLGFALGMVSTSMQPIFAQLVDLRHTAVYGNVYAISDMSVCLAMFLGPLVGGPIVYTFGFQWLVVGVGVLNLAFCQLCILLRNPPARNVDKDDKLQANGVLPNQEVNHKGDTEKQPLLEAKRKRTYSQTSSKTSTTMDLSHLPIPRYLQCLSAAEDLHAESVYSMDLSKGHESL